MSLVPHSVGDALIVAGAVGSGVVGGALFAFSSFVMPALDKLPPERAIGAMQSINRQAVTPPVMFVLLGTAVVSTGLGVDGIRRLGEREGQLLVAGAALYLLVVVITGLFHVPRNDRLVALTLPVGDAGSVWTTYSSAWTAGNHVRTLLAVAAAVVFTLARALR